MLRDTGIGCVARKTLNTDQHIILYGPMIKKALDWIEMQQPDSIKRISQVVWARGAWKLPSLHTLSYMS